jgi:exo-beta-1,3-glucanase (GH17 family)
VSPDELPHVAAICYSGYRREQSPADRTFPSSAEILEDLRLLEPDFGLIRLYDSGEHAQRVLDAIERHGLRMRVLLGAHLAAEEGNPGCPWGGLHDVATLAANRLDNDAEIGRLVALAGRYPRLVWAVAVGNEATVDWTDHLVPVERVIELVRRVRASVSQPVTVCENYVPWQCKLAALVPELDFIALHTYPVWEYRDVHEAVHYTRENYHAVAGRYPSTPVIITEAGWATASNGRGIPAERASEAHQARYCAELLEWAAEAGVLTFVFEAFDEPWKGSPDPLEPEKHWGLYDVDRRSKRVVDEVYVPRRAHIAAAQQKSSSRSD